MKALQKLPADIVRDWMDEENRITGHVALPPPISFNHVDGGITEVWAAVELSPAMISELNLAGNAIDLRSVAVDEFTTWMQPQFSNISAYKSPGDRLLRFLDTVSDDERQARVEDQGQG